MGGGLLASPYGSEDAEKNARVKNAELKSLLFLSNGCISNSCYDFSPHPFLVS